MKKLFLLFFPFSFFIQNTNAQSVSIEPFSEGYNWLIGFEVAPEDDRLYAFQKDGFIKICNTDGSIEPTPFLDISAKVNNSFNNEQGLVGLAFHPDYQTNGRFFVFYNEIGTGVCAIARYERSTTNPNIADPSSETILLTWEHPLANHVGGCMKFGPDGYLYIASGDGGSPGGADGAAQNLESYLGKILRIDVDAGDTYATPAGNPFIGAVDALPEIYALGLRNPWRIAFDPIYDQLFIADVGQNTWEEINYREAGDEGGGKNYGWPCREGSGFFDDSQCSNLPGFLTFPYHIYAHVPGGDCSISGGDVSFDATQGDLFGNYFFTDYCSGKIWLLEHTIDFPNVYEVGDFNDLDFTMIGRDNKGQLYAVGFFSNTIYKIESENCDPYAELPPPYSINIFEGNTTTISAYDADGLTFQWLQNEIEINGANSNELIVSETGEYTVVVTNSENGCSSTSHFPVTVNVNPLSANISGQAEVCEASSHYYNADIFPDATYEWSVTEGTILDGQGTSEVFILWDNEGIGALNLTTTLSDGTIFEDELWVEILVNDLSLQANFSEGVCPGTNDGFIDLTIEGTGNSFEYFWSNNETTEDIFNLVPDAYKVTVTSDLGCQAFDGFILFETEIPTLNWEAFPQICSTPGNISGIGNSANCGDFPLPTFEDLEAGEYYVSATDCFGCTYIDTLEIIQVFNFFILEAIVSQPTQGESDGSIEIIPDTGIEPFSYLWSDGSTENPRTDLPAGEYSVTITDGFGCATTMSFLLEGVNSTSSSYLENNTSIFPNPSSGLFSLQFNLKEAENINVKLLDTSGKLIEQLMTDKNYGTGEIKIDFDLSEKVNGIYILEIKVGEEIFGKQIIKE